MKLLNAITLSTVISLSALLGAEFNVDKTHSNIGFKVRHMMVSYTRGHFEDFEGSYDYDDSSKTIRSLEGIVKVASIDTRDEKRDKDLRDTGFFDAKKYPLMKLRLIKHNGNKVLVDLTIKKTTRQVQFELEDLGGESKDPWGNIRNGFVLKGEINRKNFGMNLSQVLETGGIAVGNEVKITLEIEGIKTQSN